MIASLRAAALTLPIVVLGTSSYGFSDYDPQILTLRFAGGETERVAATSPASCAAAVRAIERGWWVPVGGGVVAASCAAGDLFRPGSQYIAGFNDPAGRRR